MGRRLLSFQKKAGDVITKKRNRLGPTKAEMILFFVENDGA
jgi:hypothetical protein